MVVIEHETTGERFNYPSVPINKETAEGFTQTYYVPKGYKLAEDQTPVIQTKVTTDYPVI